MGIKIGVVCEGSHDFAVLQTFVNKICENVGVELDTFKALQPEVSATFAQVGTGGWGAVKGWCETGNGTFYRTFLDAPLFANSTIYDLLLIHVDGDVLDLCEAGPLAGKTTDGQACANIVSQLEEAVLKSWLSIREEDARKLVVCIPVRHLEAWLLAGLAEGDTDFESYNTKDEFRDTIGKVYKGKNLQLYQKASRAAVDKIDAIRAKCFSYSSFEAKFSEIISGGAPA
jgi:hypothetical protein